VLDRAETMLAMPFGDFATHVKKFGLEITNQASISEKIKLFPDYERN